MLNTFSIDAYNALIASIYLHQYFCILKSTRRAYFFTISQQQIQIPFIHYLLFYTKSSPGSVLLLGGILGIRQSQSKI